MPEIAEVALMADAIREIIDGKMIESISILGGRYWVYKIPNPENPEEFISRVDKTDPTTGQVCYNKRGKPLTVKVSPKTHPDGKWFEQLDGLTEIRQYFPLKVSAIIMLFRLTIAISIFTFNNFQISSTNTSTLFLDILENTILKLKLCFVVSCFTCMDSI